MRKDRHNKKIFKYLLISFVVIFAIICACLIHSCSSDDDTDKDKDDEINEFYDENIDSDGWI